MLKGISLIHGRDQGIKMLFNSSLDGFCKLCKIAVNRCWSDRITAGSDALKKGYQKQKKEEQNGRQGRKEGQGKGSETEKRQTAAKNKEQGG
jgi:hypothetical protein